MGVMRDALVRAKVALQSAYEEYGDEGDRAAAAEISDWIDQDGFYRSGIARLDVYRSFEEKLRKRKRINLLPGDGIKRGTPQRILDLLE